MVSPRLRLHSDAVRTRGQVARRIGIVVTLAGVVTLGWVGIQAWQAWNRVNRVPFEPESARIALAEIATGETGGEATTTSMPAEPTETSITTMVLAEDGPSSGDDFLDVYLIIGTDSAAGTTQRADVILLFIVPDDGLDPVMVSIPRDLYATDLCTGAANRINVNLNGCGAVSGPEQMAVAVEDFTGLRVDHFALFDFDSFRHVVDRVGGVEICTPYPVRDLPIKPVPLQLPAGCTVQGGYQALAWVRSRHTEGLIGDTWQPVASSDLVRNARQQDLLLQALERVAEMRDVSELAALVEDVAPSLTVDDDLDLGTVISTAWNLRGRADAVRTAQIPVVDFTDPLGRAVLRATQSFTDVLIEASPEFAPWLTA